MGLILGLDAAPLGTAFTYQGQLQQAGRPANGWYDFQFNLYEDGTNGALVGATQVVDGLWVSNGLFSVSLDFGDVFDGNALWLEIAVRTNGNAVGFTTLAPRQSLTAAPFAHYAPSAGIAATAQYANTAGQAAALSSPLGSDKLTGLYSSPVSFNYPGNAFSGAFYGQTYGSVYGSVYGNVYGNLFGTVYGDGSGLFNLNAGDLATGTVPDGRLSTNVALLGANQRFAGSNTFAGTLFATNPANQMVGSFSGNGASLYNLNAGNLATGTLPDAQLSANVALLGANQRFAGSNTFAGTLFATNPANQMVGSFTGDGTGLYNLNAGNLATGTLPDAQLSDNVALLGANQWFVGSNTFIGALIATNPANQVVGSFTGDGAGLYNLNAGNLATGTLPDAQLSANVALLGANQEFDGSNIFAGALIAINSENQIVGSFTGDGTGLYNLNAANLAFGTVPDAQLSTNVALLGASQLFAGSNTYAGALIATNPANQLVGNFTGAGAGLYNLNAANLAFGTVPEARLSTNVVLLGASQQFTGSNTFAAVFAGSQTVSNLSAVNIAATNISAGTLTVPVAGGLIVSDSAGGLDKAFSIGNRDWDWTEPVAFIRPVATGNGAILDLIPNGASGTNTYHSWLDICDTDVEAYSVWNAGHWLDLGINTDGHGSISMLSFQDITDLVLQEQGGRLGIGIGAPGQFIDALCNTNSPTVFRLVNTDPGTSARTELRLQNGSTSGNGGTLLVGVTGTNYSPSDCYKANAGIIQTIGGLSGGLSISASAPSAEIRFYSGGTSDAAWAGTIDSNRNWVIPGNLTVGTISTTATTPPAMPSWWTASPTEWRNPDGTPATLAPIASIADRVAFGLGIQNGGGSGYSLYVPFGFTNGVLVCRTAWLVPPQTTNQIFLGTTTLDTTQGSLGAQWTYTYFWLTNASSGYVYYNTNLTGAMFGSVGGVKTTWVTMARGYDSQAGNQTVWLMSMQVQKP